MKVHEIDLRLSTGDGLFAELPAERFPVPSRDVDAEPISWRDVTCVRRHCEQPASWALTSHRKYTRRQASADEVWLCSKDLQAHRDGITFLVGVVSNR